MRKINDLTKTLGFKKKEKNNVRSLYLLATESIYNILKSKKLVQPGKTIFLDLIQYIP